MWHTTCKNQKTDKQEPVFIKLDGKYFYSDPQVQLLQSELNVSPFIHLLPAITGFLLYFVVTLRHGFAILNN